jgi:hypothetical protein
MILPCPDLPQHEHLYAGRCSASIGGDTKQSNLLKYNTENGMFQPQSGQGHFKKGDMDMGDKGKKDKGKREDQKKAQLNPKEKRKLKKEKKK